MTAAANYYHAENSPSLFPQRDEALGDIPKLAFLDVRDPLV